MTYTQDAHPFYLLNAPAQQFSVCYDGETGAWHDRAWLAEDGCLSAGAARSTRLASAASGGRLRGPAVYDMRLDYYLDDERALVRVRRMPTVEAQQRRLRHSMFRLRCDAGVGLDGGAIPGMDPQMRSDGRTMTARRGRARSGECGRMGRRGRWSSGDVGADRQRSYELRCSDPVPIRWTDAWVEVQLMARTINPAPDSERHCGTHWRADASCLGQLLPGVRDHVLAGGGGTEGPRPARRTGRARASRAGRRGTQGDPVAATGATGVTGTTGSTGPAGGQGDPGASYGGEHGATARRRRPAGADGVTPAPRTTPGCGRTGRAVRLPSARIPLAY